MSVKYITRKKIREKHSINGNHLEVLRMVREPKFFSISYHEQRSDKDYNWVLAVFKEFFSC